jgi:manganese/zinc/iron transport system permease protein
LLRGAFELLEKSQSRGGAPVAGADEVDLKELLTRRSWTPNRLKSAVRRARQHGLVVWEGGMLRLTRAGQTEAIRLTRQHRLWELYLITHADVAPARVDREADSIEHVLEPEIIAELESLLAGKTAIPASPHELAPAPAPARGTTLTPEGV